VAESVVVSDQQLAVFSRNLGGQIVRASNTTLAVDGQRFKVNTITCKTDEDAAKVHDALLRAHNGQHEYCPRDGKVVVEFVGKDARLVERAYLELGFKPPRRTYDVSFHAAPVVKCDYMAWNKMYVAFLAPEPAEARVRELAKSFTFGDQIRLRNHGLGGEASSYSFTPRPRNTRPEADGEVTAYSFAELPRKHGVPQVAVTAVVSSEAFALTPSSRKAGPELLGPTEFWPSTDAEVVALAKRITGERADPGEKVAAILGWFVPGRNVRYDGKITGSRYGTKTVLKQGYGHCWDFSDCFVTLCRASGVPCRQVLGWVHGLSGHVWAEVLVEGKGWRQVDPTAGMGCDTRYVPLVATETGAMPMVYTSAVRVAPRGAGDRKR
jgi:transglutaminase-like putative cysteine protease